MNQMIGRNRKCDLTCLCSNRIRKFDTYALFKQPDHWGAGVITICESCFRSLSHNRWFKRAIKCFNTHDGSPVEEKK